MSLFIVKVEGLTIILVQQVCFRILSLFGFEGTIFNPSERADFFIFRPQIVLIQSAVFLRLSNLYTYYIKAVLR